MPLHTLGVSGGRDNVIFGITKGDIVCCIVTLLFYWQPGVDHQAVMQWIIDHWFFGSIGFCSVFGTFYSHKLLEWGGMGFYSFLYWYELHPSWPGAKRIAAAKLDTEATWPWTDKKKEVGEKYIDLRTKTLRYVITFHVIVTFVQFLVFVLAINYSWTKNGFEWNYQDPETNQETGRADPAKIPSKFTVAYQCLISSFVAETGFYFAHRLMHETRLYYWHKRHHEYREATVYATFYVGLFDSIITDMIPAGFGLIYFNMHQWTIWMYSLPLIANAIRSHCGYDNMSFLGFNIILPAPLCTETERTHDMHHRFNTGNYGGGYFVWDRICGTWLDPDEEIRMKKEGKKYEPLPRGQQKAAVQPVLENGKKVE